MNRGSVSAETIALTSVLCLLGGFVVYKAAIMGQLLSSSSASNEKANVTGLLLQAAMEGDLDRIRSLIREHVGDKKEEDGYREALREFVNRKDAQGNACLHGSVFGGHLSVTKFLVEECNADTEVQNGMGCSPVWIAAGYGHVDVLKYLIVEKNCSATCVNNSGDTPLLAAVSKGHAEVCELLLEEESDLLYQKNNAGDTPLSVCIGAGHEGPLLSLLLDSEDKQQQKDATTTRPLNDTNSKGLTPLLVACERNSASIVGVLLSKRDALDLTTTDPNGRSPLAVAAFCGCDDAVHRLLEDDHTKAMLDRRDDHGCTPLWLAARTGNAKMVDVLVRAGADATIPDNNDGTTPEQAAVRYKKEAVVNYFKEKKETTEEKETESKPQESS